MPLTPLYATLLILITFTVIVILIVRARRKQHQRQSEEGDAYTYPNTEEAIEINTLITKQRGLLRDRAGLESALNRPRTAAFYEQADISAQAATLIEGIALNHPFVDGNKRTALLCGVTFLDINGYRLTARARQEAGPRVEQLVIARNSDQFTDWIRANLRRK